MLYFQPLTTGIDVASTGQPQNSATIYAMFDSSNTLAENVQPGCQLDASWPSNYGDVYFGADNCLYDSSGKISGKCMDVNI